MSRVTRIARNGSHVAPRVDAHGFATFPVGAACLLPQHRPHVLRLTGRGRCPLPLLHLLTRTYQSKRAALAAVASYRAAGIPTYRLAALPLGA